MLRHKKPFYIINYILGRRLCQHKAHKSGQEPGKAFSTLIPVSWHYIYQVYTVPTFSLRVEKAKRPNHAVYRKTLYLLHKQTSDNERFYVFST